MLIGNPILIAGVFGKQNCTAVLLILTYCVLSTSAIAEDMRGTPHGLIEYSLQHSSLRAVNCSELYGLGGRRYACGFLQVPEDYTEPQGNQIMVPYLLIFPEEDTFDTSLTPLLIAGGGGPGNALLGNRYYQLDDSTFWAYEEFSINDGRLLMLLENRGTGLSKPNLDCHYGPEIYRQSHWKELLQADSDCGGDFMEDGIDLSQYNVFNAALDIEMFRRLYGEYVISTGQLNLYGVSYGTRLAMYYERLFPEKVRSLVLDSVAVNGPNHAEDELLYAQSSLDLVFSSCRADRACSKTFGQDLELRFYQFLDTLDERKLMLKVSWPGRQMPVELPLTATVLIDIVHSALYGSDTFATIPSLIQRLLDGSYTRVTSALNDYVDSYSPRYSFSDTAFLAYLCYDTDYSKEIHVRLKKSKLLKYWKLNDARQYMAQVCSIYDADAAQDLLQQDFFSETPTLFLSGKLDPVTPPESADKIAGKYQYHWHIIREAASHDVISHSSCARYLASWFVYHLEEDLSERLDECEPEDSPGFQLE